MKILLIVLFVAFYISVPAQEQAKTIRWQAADLPKECCRDYIRDGNLVTFYEDAKLGYVIGLHFDVDKKYIAFLIYFQNHSDSSFTVYPENFSMRMTNPVNKTFSPVDIESVAKSIEKRGNTVRFLRALMAGMARQDIYGNSTSTGRVTIADNSGNSGYGIYNGNSKTVISVPDYEAQRQAREKNDAEMAKNKTKSIAVQNYALRANTLFKDEIRGGFIFFKKDKLADGMILSFTIGNVTYEVPYANERISKK